MTCGKYSSLQRLDGKVVLVTGAMGVLGRHFCHGFAELGASVAVVDIDSSMVDTFANELVDQHSVRAVGVACDVSSPESVDQMVDQVVSNLGAINVLHNNAATKGNDTRAFFTCFEDYSLEIWREIMAVNIDGMFLVAKSAGKRMIRQGSGGSIIQTSSIYGMLGPDPRIYEGSNYLGGPINTPAVYATSKAAVIGLTRYLATYWAPHNIRVNCLVPGGVESGQNIEFLKRYSQRVPLGRMARAYEIVGAALFLASDLASYVTGQVLAVDGGWSAW
jgi:NAD(P)-dependent dehydrogenase (short-subunit alcohol dehydrogenase family)